MLGRRHKMQSLMEREQSESRARQSCGRAAAELRQSCGRAAAGLRQGYIRATAWPVHMCEGRTWQSGTSTSSGVSPT